MAQRNNVKKHQKQNRKRKQRAEKIRRQTHAAKFESRPGVNEAIDYALERLDDGDFREGAKIIEKLKKKHRNHAYLTFAMGVLATRRDHIDAAIGHFLRATELSPDFVEAHFNLGVAYHEKVKVPQLVESFRKVLEIGEPGSGVVEQARHILDRIEQGIREDDDVDLDTYVESQNLFDHGVMQMNAGNWGPAITDFEASNEIVGHHAQVFGNMGICHAKLGNREAAIEAFDKALAIDPEYEPALLNREITLTLDDGCPLEGKVKTIEYYKDYSMGKRSYIEDFARDHNLLPNKS